MRTLPRFFPVTLLAFASAANAAAPEPYVIDHRHSPESALRPLPYDAVQWTGGFWAERYRQLTEVTLDESWRLLADPAKGHVLDNFRIAAQPDSGKFVGVAWHDEWLYKWLEAAACVWRNTRDPVLARRMDDAIALVTAAQQSDGYLSTNITATQRPRLTDLPPPSEQVARGGPGGYFRGETRPRRGCVRRRLTGFFRDNFGAGNAGKTARISCCAAA